MKRSPRYQIAYAALIIVGAAFLCVPLGACQPSSATAEDYVARPSSPIDAGWPPPRFRGDNTVPKVTFAGSAKVRALCGVPAKPDQEVLACTGLTNTGDATRMVLPNPCVGFHGEEFAKLACHELGHVNSWPIDHGG